MKKSLLFVAAASLGMMASAQTVILPPTAEEAQAAGFEALWGDYQYGYVLPQDYTLVDNEAVKVVMNNGSASKPGANVGFTGLNTEMFDRAFYMGSAASYGAFEGVYSLEFLSEGIKQPYAIFTVDAKVGGELAIYSNRGKNKYTMYVWDTTINEGVGTYVLASSSQAGDAGKNLVQKATVGLTAGHTYWVFGSETGANILMYGMDYTPYASESYNVTEAEIADFSNLILPPNMEEAQAAGFDALWGSYDYGYVLPQDYQLVDNEDLKVVMNNGSASKPGANVSTTSLNTELFDRAFNMGSAASFGAFEGVYSLEFLSEGIKQPYAIFTVDAKKGGELSIFSNRGKNKYTMYVWDTTINEGVGTYVLASSAQAGDYKNLVQKATVGLTAGHKYWVFGSETGANILMYGMGFNSFDSQYYGYSGIAGVAVDAVPQSNVIYNFQGQIVDENYKGFVIKNGKKYLQK